MKIQRCRYLMALLVVAPYGSGCHSVSRDEDHREEKAGEDEALPELTLPNQVTLAYEGDSGIVRGPSSSFIAPNERHAEHLAQVLAKAPRRGICIALGTERALFTAYLADCAGLYGLDINAAVPLFHAINRSLLRDSTSLAHYNYLRLQADLSDWQAALQTPQPGNLEGLFLWWKTFVRSSVDHPLHKKDPLLASVNYLVETRVFEFLKNLSSDNPRRQRTYLVDLYNKHERAAGYEDVYFGPDEEWPRVSSLQSFSRELDVHRKAAAERGRPIPEIAVIDVSNAIGTTQIRFEGGPSRKSVALILGQIEALFALEGAGTNDIEKTAADTHPVLVFTTYGRSPSEVFWWHVGLDIRSYFVLSSEAREECLAQLTTEITRAMKSELPGALAFSCPAPQRRCVGK